MGVDLSVSWLSHFTTNIPLLSVCADGFHTGEVPSTDTATWEAEFKFLSPINRPWLEERHGVLGLCTAGVISSINDK